MMSCSTPVTSSLAHHVHKHGIWAVICTACSLQLRAIIILVFTYSLILHIACKVYVEKCEHWHNILILYLCPVPTSQVHQRSPGNTGAATPIMLSFSACVYIVITVWLHPSVLLSNLICFILNHYISCMHLLSPSNI